MATARIDRGSLAKPLAGTLYEAVVARTHRDGDALSYPTGPEYRDIAELDRIVSQLPGLPLVAGYSSDLGHPTGLMKYGGLGRVIGKVISARRDGNEAIASIMVADDSALEQIHDGTSEVSLGYECELDDRRMQRATNLDHISIVSRGRCTGPGGKCALRVDAAEAGATCGCSTKIDAKLTAAARHAIPGHLFADPAHEGLPLEDATHVRDAMARFGQEHFASSSAKAAGFHHILARAKALGIDASGFEKAHSGQLDHAEPGTGTPCACATLAKGGNLDHPGIHMADQPVTETKDQAELQTKLDQATADLKVATARAEAAELDRDNARKDAEKFSKEIDAAKARADAAEADAVKAKTEADAAVTAAKTQSKLDADNVINTELGERIALLAQVTEVVGKDNVKVSDSPRALKRALIVKVDGEDVPADKQENDSYIDGMYAGALKRAAIATESRVELREATQQMREDGAAEVATTAAEREAEAKKRAAAHASSQWQRKPAN